MHPSDLQATKPLGLANFKLATWLLLLASLLLGFLSLLVPLPEWDVPGSLQLTMFFATIVSVLHFGAPYLFHIGLSQFTSLLRRAYLLMFVGIILLGLAHAQNILITVLGAWNGFWVRGGLIAVPFFFSVIFIYLGANHFARLLHISSFSTKSRAAFFIAVLASAFAAFIPPFQVPPTFNFAMSLAFTAWGVALFLITAAVLLRIKSTISSRYTVAMLWLFWSMVANALAGIHYMGMLVILPQDHWYEPYGFVPFLLAALILVKAGYAFNRIDLARPSTKVQPNYSPVDVIISIAELASQPSEIDPILDDLRIVTLHNPDPRHLSEPDQVKLADIFTKLKQYLLKQEPLKKITNEDIDALIKGRYDSTSGQYAAFWNTFYK